MAEAPPHDNRGPELAAVTATFLVLATVSVAFRSYTMAFLLKRFFVEDYLAVITLVFFIAFCSFVFLGVSHGLGAHVYDVPLSEHPKALLWKWAGQVFYVLVAALVKFVVGLFLLRICSRQRWQRIVIWTLLGLTGIFNAFYLVLAILQCRPVEFYWFRYDPNPPVTGECNHKALAIIPSYISLILNVVTDVTLAVLPVSVVWKAQMERRLKLSVSFVLALGSLASIATIARIPYAKQLLSNPDYLYNFTDLSIWSTVEIGLAITASSLATLKPLFRRFKLLVTTRGGNSGATNQTKQRSSAYIMGSAMAFSSRRATLQAARHSKFKSLQHFQPVPPRSPGVGAFRLDSSQGEKTLVGSQHDRTLLGSEHEHELLALPKSPISPLSPISTDSMV